MISFRNFSITVIATCSLMIQSCNESLPVRDDLTGQFSATVLLAFQREGAENNFRIYITVKNNTDETIEERASFGGTVEIQWIPSMVGEAPPEVNTKRTFSIGNGNIFRAAGYNRETAMLRLAANDSVVFSVSWNLRTNDSTFLPRYWAVYNDTQCKVRNLNGEISFRRITHRQKFLVSANVKIFNKLAVLYSAPTYLKQCYVAPYKTEVNPPEAPCTNINIFDPCSIVE